MPLKVRTPDRPGHIPRTTRLYAVLEGLAIGLLPLLLLLAAWLRWEQSALLTLVAALLASLPFFLHFEASRPAPKDILPIVVMAALATAGRILFAPLASFKPVSAIVIVTALVYGPQSGYMTGALAALTSNLFFGQGPWTPWQMFAWGLVGYLAGQLHRAGRLNSRIGIYVYGFLSGLLFGVIVDSWYIVGFVEPINRETVLAAYLAGLPFNLTHSVATVMFLVPILGPWQRKLERLKRKFG